MYRNTGNRTVFTKRGKVTIKGESSRYPKTKFYTSPDVMQREMTGRNIPGYSPPISSRQDPTKGYPLPAGASVDDRGRVVDENSVPMNLSSIGWMKDMRFYRPDGTFAGMM